jgi:hypothetical protein
MRVGSLEVDVARLQLGLDQSSALSLAAQKKAEEQDGKLMQFLYTYF